MSSINVSSQTNGSVIDVESGPETARLMHQHRLLTSGMGGLLPAEITLGWGQKVLDLACGPGCWVLDVAYSYPDALVTGIDLSRTTIEYGRDRARVQGLDNADFLVMDVSRPLDFADESFDLAHARLLAGFMPASAWPSLVRECLRITRPGGVICLTEGERGISTSPALEELTALYTQAHKRAGHSFSPDGRTIGITPVLGRFLREAGCVRITHRAYALDYSLDTPLSEAMVQNVRVACSLLEPFLSKMGVVTPERFEELYQQVQIELLADDFCGLWPLLSVWGMKPGGEVLP